MNLTDLRALVWSAACLLRDDYVFPLFQVVVFALFAFAVWKDLNIVRRIRDRFFRSGTLKVEAIRGPASREYFHLAYGLGSVVLLQIVNAANVWHDYKTAIGLADVGILLYLAYFNRWMRNRIVGFVTKWQKRPD
jgi:hypothetical protein